MCLPLVNVEQMLMKPSNAKLLVAEYFRTFSVNNETQFLTDQSPRTGNIRKKPDQVF